MSSFSGFTESTGSVSSSVRANFRGSEVSPIMFEEVLDSGYDKSYDHPNFDGMLLSEVAESSLPCRSGYDWASSLVTSRFSRYRWSSMVETYVASMPMFTTDNTSTKMFVKRCTSIDNVCHGREGHNNDFFYIYVCMFTDSIIRLPFDEFNMGMLRMFNVALT